jgi:hypothetical protein
MNKEASRRRRRICGKNYVEGNLIHDRKKLENA